MRACDRLGYFRSAFQNRLKEGANATFCLMAANRWIGFRLDMICAVCTGFIAFFLVLAKGTVDKALLIMSLQVSIDVVALLSLSFRMYVMLNENM